MPPFSFLGPVLLCAFLWGSAFPLIKAVYQSWPGTPLLLCLFFAGVRFTIAGATLLAFCRPLSVRLAHAQWPLLGCLALTQTFLQYCLFYAGMAVSSGVLGALLVSFGSFWWILLAPWILKTAPPRFLEWAALGVSSLGVAVAVYAPGAGSGQVWLGSALFLGASLSGALALIIMRPLSQSVDARTATAVGLLGGGLLLLLVGASSAPLFLALLTWKTAGITLALAAVSAISFSVWNRLAHEYSINLLANYRFLIPLSGMIQSSLFVAGEAPGPGVWLGGVLILGSLYVLERGKRALPAVFRKAE